MRIDYSKVSDEQTVYELLPEGQTVLKVVKAEEKVAPSTGNIYWAVTLENKEEVKVYDTIFFTEKTLNRTKKYFSNLGLDVDGEYDYDPDDIIGLCFKADIKIEDYIDKQGNKKQKNTVNIWDSEKLATAKKTASKPKKEDIIDESEIPF